MQTEMPIVDGDATLESVQDLNAEVIDAETDRQHLRELLSDPQIVAEVRHYFADLQMDYLRRASEIEKFLGFVESREELGTRLHKVEAFLGIKV